MEIETWHKGGILLIHAGFEINISNLLAHRTSLIKIHNEYWPNQTFTGPHIKCVNDQALLKLNFFVFVANTSIKISLF